MCGGAGDPQGRSGLKARESAFALGRAATQNNTKGIFYDK